MSYTLQKLNRRIEVLLHPDYQDLRVHLPLYNRLGVEGMSSEEEMEGFRGPDDLPTFRTFRPDFISIKLSQLNGHLDDIHGQRITPRTYIRKPPISKPSDKWIRKLAFNVYNPGRLHHLRPEQKRLLEIDPRPHPFVHYKRN